MDTDQTSIVVSNEPERSFQVFGGALLCFAPDAPVRHIPLSEIKSWVDFAEVPVRSFRLRLTGERYVTFQDPDGSLEDILVLSMSNRFLFPR